MPIVNQVARCEPLTLGAAKFTLSRFNAQKTLGPDYAKCIDLIVVRKNEARLDSWVSPNQDGFITIIPKNPRQRAQDFEFEVGPEVVNPMAFDNSGDYILRIRDKNGILLSFSLSMQGTPRADTAFVPKTPPAQEPAKGIDGGYEPPRSNAKEDAMFGANGPSMPYMGAEASAGAAGAAGATSSGMGSLIAKIFAGVLVLALIGAGVSYFMGMWSLPGSNVAQEETQAPQEELTLTEEDKQSVQEDMQSEPEKEPEVVASSPCSFAASTGNAQEVLRNCLQSNPDAMQLDSFLKEALKTGQCEVATKLLSSKARSTGGGKYAYLYAMLSDPNSSVNSVCVNKDAKDANYWMNHAKRDQNFTEADGQNLVKFFMQ